jgi:hypothetical protein
VHSQACTWVYSSTTARPRGPLTTGSRTHVHVPRTSVTCSRRSDHVLKFESPGRVHGCTLLQSISTGPDQADQTVRMLLASVVRIPAGYVQYFDRPKDDVARSSGRKRCFAYPVVLIVDRYAANTCLPFTCCRLMTFVYHVRERTDRATTGTEGIRFYRLGIEAKAIFH